MEEEKELTAVVEKTKKEKELSLIVLQAEMTDDQLQVLVSEIKTVAEWIGIKLTIKSE
jgi:uncharacterized protein YejL (UPF0352 family)